MTEEQRQHLIWQLELLDRAINAYDTGAEVEALHISATLRILCHNTNTSHALLHQLGFNSTWTFCDSSNDEPAVATGVVWPLLAVVLNMAESTITYRALMDGGGSDNRLTNFEAWWNGIAVRDERGVEFSRKNIVLGVANQDGGSHIDPELDPDFRALGYEQSMGHPGYSVGRDPHRSPVWEALRQIAYEMQETASRNLPDYAPPPRLRPGPMGPAVVLRSVTVLAVPVDAPPGAEARPMGLGGIVRPRSDDGAVELEPPAEPPST